MSLPSCSTDQGLIQIAKCHPKLRRIRVGNPSQTRDSLQLNHLDHIEGPGLSQLMVTEAHACVRIFLLLILLKLRALVVVGVAHLPRIYFVEFLT